MSIEQPDIIDGVGVRPDGSVEMLISDHLEWDHEQHLQMLTSKVEAYANAALSGLLVESYPPAEGKRVSIKLVCQHVPNAGVGPMLAAIEAQLRQVGIGFSQTELPD